MSSEWLHGGVPPETPERVESIEALPYIYDAIQLMYSESDILVAYTWNGEAYTIVTANGEVRGSSFHELSDDVAEKLLNQ